MKRVGIIFQPGALWLGAYYSADNRRWCINILPMFTVFVVLKGGRPPKRVQPMPPLRLVEDTARGLSGVAKYRQRQRMMDCEPARQWSAECERTANRRRGF